MSTQMASQQQMHGQNVVEDTAQVEIEIKKRTFDACHACLLRPQESNYNSRRINGSLSTIGGIH
jgi:hypothetical protein